MFYFQHVGIVLYGQEDLSVSYGIEIRMVISLRVDEKIEIFRETAIIKFE